MNLKSIVTVLHPPTIAPLGLSVTGMAAYNSGQLNVRFSGFGSVS
jgi:hypothetical protein